MKYRLTLLLLLTVISGYCQSSSIEWSVSSQKVNGKNFIITVRAKTKNGWYIYANDDSVNKLTPVDISWDNVDIRKISILQKIGTDTLIHDKIFDNKTIRVYNNGFQFIQPIQIEGGIPPIFKITIHGFSSNGKEFQPIDESRLVQFQGNISKQFDLASQLKLSTVDLANPKTNCGGEQKNGKGLINLFLLGVAGGLIALLTPCVFPMIPVTVSFFTNRARTKKDGIKNGLFYWASIFLIYLIASIPFHLISNISPEILNSISTNAWVNIAFFVVFIFFALSFFGLFEISLPSGVVSKTDSKSRSGSFTGIFFMALTLAAVSFSCTGPILGSLLVGSLSTSGGAWQLTAGMGGFGFALALPFGLFSMFPDWLKGLPKSGGWLITLKKVLAFLELAMAFKFLSNADLVQHWGILKREIFIGIWILISAGLTIYLFSTAKKIFGACGLLFTIYLIPGLTNSKYANLKLLSGFPPPLTYSIYNDKKYERLKPDFMNDYANALELSKKDHKPMLIDFTGWACVNCRKMEEQVWTDPEISSMIKNKFILVSLYVDDRKKLGPNEQFIYKTNAGVEKEILTTGDKWATFQAENFSQVTQPLYVILNPAGELMNLPVGYTPDINKYKAWLVCGLGADSKY
jgi:thiol:disulfide interchange protein